MDKKSNLPEATSRLEWLVAGLGAMLISSIIGYLIYDGITYPDSPPDVTVSQTSALSRSEGFLVEFTARNSGNTTAANLVVTGSLMDGDKVVEEAEVTLDYLPQQAERKGGLFFRNDPSEHEVTLQAGGYTAP
ncbi:TIGR02588 family protein [Paracoccus sp. (in: a-proteobacteria)]|uniref:TIGR02588 family protein n=1 Tax=Paracoccus sp. TaxID=267 RepID=UPI00396CD258